MERVVHSVVFADGEGGGNPCPIVFGAGGWETPRMQALAAELGHETVFVLDPQAGGDVRLRYFVPHHEMEMCVHATVAVAVLLAREERESAGGVAEARHRPASAHGDAGAETPLGRRPSAAERDAVMETPLGLLGVRVEGDSAVVEQLPPVFGPALDDPSEVLAALGAPAAAPAPGPVLAVSTARPKLMVPLTDERALDALAPDFPALWALCRRLEVTGAYPFTVNAAGADAAARQFPVEAGYDEDPATGVAACALAAHLSHAPGWNRWTIAQGRAMGRPSIITAEALREGDVITATRVGGVAAFE